MKGGVTVANNSYSHKSTSIIANTEVFRFNYPKSSLIDMVYFWISFPTEWFSHGGFTYTCDLALKIIDSSWFVKDFSQSFNQLGNGSVTFNIDKKFEDPNKEVFGRNVILEAQAKNVKYKRNENTSGSGSTGNEIVQIRVDTYYWELQYT